MTDDLAWVPFVDGVCPMGGEGIPRYSRDVIRPRLVSQTAVYARDGWHCVYCGTSWETVAEEHPHGPTFALDHVVPEIAGGPRTVGNLVAACHRCNSGKSGHRLQHEEPILADVAARSRAVGLDPDWFVRKSQPNLGRGFVRFCEAAAQAVGR